MVAAPSSGGQQDLDVFLTIQMTNSTVPDIATMAARTTTAIAIIIISVE
jgi:hypothetical protein